MKDSESRELRRRFANQHGLAERSELRLLGVDSRMERSRLRIGEWQRAGRRVIRLASYSTSPEQALLAACMEAGPSAIASHQSATWLWGLSPTPYRHSVTVARRFNPRVDGADVHRTSDPPRTVRRLRGIPVTDPLRALIDLAAVTDGSSLDSAVDAALARRLVSAEGLMAEAERISRRGRRGTAPLRASLRRRGIVGAPAPSVLESKLLRLLGQHGIVPLEVEAKVGGGGRYRVDAMVSSGLALEVDGYAYHHTPEQKAEDERRRNRLRLGGLFLLVYTWRDVTQDGSRVVAELREALEQSNPAWSDRPSPVR